MRTSLWLVVLALLAQSSARVSKRLKEDAEKNVDVEDGTKEYTLEALVADSNYTETEIYLSKLKEESTMNFGIDSATVTTNEVHNGTNRNGRILGGTPLTAATYVPPYTAYVFIQALNADQIVIKECGGVLLSSIWVLTAAQCVVLADDITVVAGTISNPTASTVKRKATAIIHPNFRLNFKKNDIALLSLYNPFSFSGTIGTALLSTVQPTTALDNIIFTTLGYGPGTDTFALNTVPVPSLTVIGMQNMNKASCNAQTQSLFVTYPGNTGCLDTAYGTKGICYADHGGPVFYTPQAGIKGKIIGINSQYIGCPRRQPSSFTWIYPYISWIHSTTRMNFT